MNYLLIISLTISIIKNMKKSQRNAIINFLINDALQSKNIGINEVLSIKEMLNSFNDIELTEDLSDLIDANGYNKQSILLDIYSN